MKKRVLLIAALAAAVIFSSDVNAQDYKPAGGEKNIEVGFTPLSSSDNPISIDYLRFRYFSSSTMAFRVGLTIDNSSSKSPFIVQNSQGADVELEDSDSNFDFGIAFGVEKHFEGTDRLSPYVGAQLNFLSASSTNTLQQLNPLDDSVIEAETTGGSTTFGLDLVLGVDYYWSQHIYMGTEVTFGFASTSFKDTETSVTGAPTVTSPGGSEFSLGEGAVGSIRVGFLF